MSTITNTDGCIELIAAVINPKTHVKPGGQKATKKKELPPLGEEWLSLAAEILDIDLEVITRFREEENA